MDLHVSSSSFFRKSQSRSKVEGTVNQQHADRGLVQAAEAVKQWLNQANLRHTAKESSEYYNHIISLKSGSDSDLEAFVLDETNIATTRKFLMHLEQVKDLLIPERTVRTNLKRPDRVFLSAYLIVAKSKLIFKSPADIDALLVTDADNMLKSFENLCRFMGETYMDNIPDEPHSPLSRKTPSSDQMFANMERYELAQAQENMEKDHRFMTEGRAYLEAFHQDQLAYFEAFSKWEFNNRSKVVKICIDQYLSVEAKRFAVLTSVEPTVIDQYEVYGRQQKSLRKRINNLLGQEGLDMLNHELQGLQVQLEARKWGTAPAEALIHELALNPEFKISLEACIISPQRDINAAILAVTKNLPDLEPMLDVLEEIRDQLIVFTPHNNRRITALQTDFSRQLLAEQITSSGLERGLYQIMYAFMEKIKEYESFENVSETVAFQREFNRKIDNMDELEFVLNKTIDFIYYKFSQLNLEKSNFHINAARLLVGRNIVAFEQNKFQERLAKNQFNLEHVLRWVDKIVNKPEKYRLDPRVLCSQYISTYMTHAICFDLLQKPGKFDLQAVPETFYLDRARLSDWHGRYQRIFYTMTALVIFKQFGGKHFAKELLDKELLEQKKRIITILETENVIDPKEAASLIGTILNMWLKDNKISLDKSEATMSAQLIQNSCAGTNQVAELAKKSMDDQLWIYLWKGYFPEKSSGYSVTFRVKTELDQLGKEICSLLRLHVQVHEAFYRNSVNARLFKPLFAVLKSPAKPAEFSRLLLSEQIAINKTHADIDRLAFVLSGLSLIKQKIIFTDEWDLKLGMRNSTMKDLARTFGLLDPKATKDELEKRLLALMIQVSRKQKNQLDLTNTLKSRFGNVEEDEVINESDDFDEQKMAEFLHRVKNGTSFGFYVFLEEIAGIYKDFTKKGSMPVLNSQLLTAEFQDEIELICKQVKNITIAIKQAQMPEDVDPVAQVIPTTMRSGGYSF